MKNKNHNIRFNTERVQGVATPALPTDTADVQVTEQIYDRSSK